MCIRDRWHSDPSGNYQGMAGICMKAEDLSKLARLLVHKGTWKGVEILVRKVLDETIFSVPQEPERGFSFWPIESQGQIVGWEANGSLGQYLAIFPESQLSAIRLIEPERHMSKSDDFNDFISLVTKLHFEIVEE